MKSLIASLLCLAGLSLSQTVWAQSDSQSNLESPDKSASGLSDFNDFGLLANIDLHLGPNLSSVSVTSTQSVPDTSGRARMMFGTGVDIGLVGIFYVQPEVDYIQRGFSETGGSGSTVTQLTAGLGYLEFPVLLKVRPYFDGRFRPFAVFGPSIGFLISRSAAVSTTDSNGVTTLSTDSLREHQFNSVLFSLNTGIGMEFELQQAVSLVLSLRYAAGLSNLESSAADASVQRTTSGSSTQLLAGLQFLL